MKERTFMNKGCALTLLLLLVIFFMSHAWAQGATVSAETDLKKMVSHIHWLGHDSFRIDAEGTVVYLDPFMLKEGGPKADLILTTHDHFDHTNPGDIKKISKSDTVIVTVAKAAEKLKGDVRQIKPGEEMTIKGIHIKAIPAYNINKFRSPGVPFHPKESGYVGYILTVNGVSIYHAGDADFIPEMKGLQPDIALLPVSGLYVMTADEAVEAAASIKAKLSIPMHVGGGIGDISAAQRFKEKSIVPARVLPLEK